LWSFRRGESWHLLFFLWALMVFYFNILKFHIFLNFLLVIFGGFQFFCVKFHKVGKGVFAFFLVNLNGFFY
jgi:hypothetical protein